MVNYEPKQGDIVELNFNPTKGHEQSGNRPALIISNDEYHRRTKLLIVCPISNTGNQFPLHLKLEEFEEKITTTGAILTQHIRTIDPKARNIKYKESVSIGVVDKVKETIILFF